MNERIEELAKQCYVNTGSPHTDHFEYWKFAELMIRECIDICKSRVGNSDYNTGRMHCVSDIQEHFGINSSDNIRAGAEIHSDKGYSESTKEKYEEAKQRRKDRREIKSILGYSRVGRNNV